jgi:diguanylate cyclase (GGDEF)-like protein/PAS domain S-box-containing protein
MIQKENTLDATKGTVLIVDDERVNRVVIGALLRKDGFETIEVETGRQALNVVQEQQLDLVLLDIYMPDFDGFDTLKEIRQGHSEHDLPVIMVTASTESKQLVKAFDLGANDYVTKPIDPPVMLARINMHLQFVESRKDLRKSEERYALVAQGTNDGLWDWDLIKNKIFYSPRWFAMLGCDENSGSSLNLWFDRIHPEDRERVSSELADHCSGLTTHFETEIRMRHEDGSFRWTLCRGLAVWDENGVAHRMAGSLTDITEGKVADGLTGLPNRVLFRERLDRCVQRQNRDPRYRFALLYLDLDNFKLVNDSLGHEAGDRLLVSIARRLENSLREADSFVSRLGGDEFAILIEGINDDEDPLHVANRIISSVNSPISLGCGREIFASVSVGISYSSEQKADSNEMLQAADTAMYHAKSQGKSCYRVFDPIMKKDAKKRLNIENELRRTVEDDGLSLHFQPIVEMLDSRVVGFEALVRWHHADIGEISPAEFIPIAEDNGLVVEIGIQVLRKACAQLAEWIRENESFSEFEVSVNLSGRQLKSAELVDQIFDIIAESGIQPHNLKLEVTESAIMENLEQGAEVLSQLRSRGVKVAIDDFGTGYSSLSYIHELAPDAVKIDRSFVDKIKNSRDKQSIIAAIIALADGLNLDVVAEGIETEIQRQTLAEMGCAFGQGFLYSRPLPPEEMFSFILNEKVLTETVE